MQRKSLFRALSLAAATCVLGIEANAAWAAVTIETVAIGNAGNAPDPATGSLYGKVDYSYNIGKYEVTNAQYVAFLNDIAGTTDTYGLYNAGGGITNTGTGTSKYAVADGIKNCPVTYVSWYDAIRFANWMTSGTTESGSYTITNGGFNSGTITIPAHSGGSATQWFLTSEDEWYKAAYYTGSGYSLYANGTSIAPVPGTDANYFNAIGSTWNGIVNGAVEQNGTKDMMGNVWEWNEALISDSYRGLRGGSFYDFDPTGYYLRADYRNIASSGYPTNENSHFGFRVSQVPVPLPSAVWAGVVGLALVAARRLRR